MPSSLVCNCSALVTCTTGSQDLIRGDSIQLNSLSLVLRIVAMHVVLCNPYYVQEVQLKYFSFK